MLFKGNSAWSSPDPEGHVLQDGVRHAVSEGLTLASPKDRPHLEYFRNIDGLCLLLSQLSAKKAKTYLTIYLLATTREALALRDVMGRLSRDKPRRSAMTVLIYLPHCIPEDPEFVKFAQRPGVELLIFGSFLETMGLAGAYVAGSTGLIQELRFMSKGYMYTTSPLPFVMDMARATLEKWTADADGEGKGTGGSGWTGGSDSGVQDRRSDGRTAEMVEGVKVKRITAGQGV
jgi:serine palmitoyltransferase